MGNRILPSGGILWDIWGDSLNLKKSFLEKIKTKLFQKEIFCNSSLGFSTYLTYCMQLSSVQNKTCKYLWRCFWTSCKHKGLLSIMVGKIISKYRVGEIRQLINTIGLLCLHSLLQWFQIYLFTGRNLLFKSKFCSNFIITQGITRSPLLG